jgi:predicted nicotinamide N-methyase
MPTTSAYHTAMFPRTRLRSKPVENEGIVRGNARLKPVALVPGIRLYQASEPVGLWQRTETAAGRTGLEPPFWGFAWAGGQALARYLLDHSGEVEGRRVVDIASGSGLVAIAAALAGAAEVVAYDVDPLAVAAIAVNAAANGVVVRGVCADILDGDGPDCDLLLVADAFYERELAERVMGFLERGWARGRGVLVGDFGRAYLPRRRLAALAAYDVPGLGALEDRDVKRTTVWELRGLSEGRLGWHLPRRPLFFAWTTLGALCKTGCECRPSGPARAVGAGQRAVTSAGSCITRTFA